MLDSHGQGGLSLGHDRVKLHVLAAQLEPGLVGAHGELRESQHTQNALQESGRQVPPGVRILVGSNRPKEHYRTIRGGANVLIFPDLTSANIAYKLLIRLGGAQTIGPILMGMSKPVQLLTRGCEVEEVVQAAALVVVDAQELEWPSVATPKRMGVSAD